MSTETVALGTRRGRAGKSDRRGRRFFIGTAWTVASFAIGVILWQVVAALGVEGIPGPLTVLRRGIEMIQSGLLIGDLLASLGRVVAGFVIGIAVAVPAGFLVGWYPVVRKLTEPWIQFLRTIPPLAMIPLVIVIAGIGEAPKVWIIFLAAFLSSVIATIQGVTSVDSVLINAARVLGASNMTIFLRVVVPASTPFILVGMRIGLGASWATLVAAELVAAQQGLGYRMQQAQIYYDLPTIFVSLITIGILGYAMDRLLLSLEHKLVGWQDGGRK